MFGNLSKSLIDEAKNEFLDKLKKEAKKVRKLKTCR